MGSTGFSSSTTTSQNGLTTSNCTVLYGKLLKTRWRRLHMESALERGIQAKFGGCTTMKIGPPKGMREDQTQKWKETLMTVWKWCVENILLVNLKDREGEIESRMVEELVKIDSKEKYERFIAGISKGIKYASSKYLNKYDCKSQKIPEPPSDKDRNIEAKSMKYYSEDNFIKRGEKWTEISNGFIRNRRIKERENVFRIIAHSIYNSTRLHSIIVRNFWTFINKYENIEKRNFRPFIGELSNGQTKYISTWNQLKKNIQNRDLKVTEYELEIIANLYCVQIRVMHDITNYNNPCLVREKYKNIWNTSRKTDRAVNLLKQVDGKWSLLEGIDYCIEDLRIRKIEEKTITWTKDQEEDSSVNIQNQVPIEASQETDSLMDIYDSIRETEVDLTVDQSIIKAKGAKEDKQDEVDTVSIQTTDSINALFYEEDKKEQDVDNISIANREEELSKNIDSLQYSGVSVATINTLPSIDSIENSTIHLKNRINTMSINDSHRQASKVALKNTLWQRCRTLERDRRRNEIKKRERKDIREGKKERNKHLVFDFTSKGLDNQEIELLSKGEGFSVANNRIDEDRLKVDLYNYTRRLRLHHELVEKIDTNQTVENSQFSKITLTQNSSRRSTSETSMIAQNARTKRGSGTRRYSVDSNTNQNYDRQKYPQDRNYPKKRQSESIKQDKETEIDNTQKNNYIKRDKPKARRPLSTYDPITENRNLVRYNNCIQEEGLLVTKQKVSFQDNITKDLRTALKKLKDRVAEKEIIITKADKRSGLVTLDYDLYIEKGTHYIEIESQAYSKTSENQKDIVTTIIKERNKIVSNLKKANIISDYTATYCTHQTEEKITGVKFYYKVHKSTDIQKMPLRPLQSCIMGPTHHLSQVLTDILQPLLTVEYMPTFIQDSNQLLVRLSKLPKLEETDTIITSDVAALYPSIPHKEGLEAMSIYLTTNSEYSKKQIELIINALRLVITKNYVKWNGGIYEQIKGVAMGTPVAVAYANIFMHWIDTEISRKATYIKEHIRYIDDNLFIIPKQKIKELMEIANDIFNPSIKYTYEALDKNKEIDLPFLDTQLFISETLEIESRLYTKKTDKHAYLLPSSYHPTHITKNIPLSTFYRLRRICSKDEWFKADAMLAIEWLEDRDYKYKDIITAIGKAIDKDRWELIKGIEENRGNKKSQNNEGSQNSTIPIIVTYSHNTMQLKKMLKQRQDILDASFTNTKVTPRLSFRRQNNLGDLLVQKSLRGPIAGEETVSYKFIACETKQKYRTNCPCKGSHNQKQCRCCAHACFEVKDIEVKLYKVVTCETKNVVYLINCKICKKKYVGETQQKLRDRLIQHLNNIQKLNQPLYTHFKTVHKPIELSITVLETMRSEEPFMRKIREAWWINKLQTLEPKGFNVKLECNQMYLEDRRRKENSYSSWK